MDKSKLEIVLSEIINESCQGEGIGPEAKISEIREYFQKGLGFFGLVRRELEPLDQRRQLSYLLGYLKKADLDSEVWRFLASLGLPERSLEEKYHQIRARQAQEKEEKVRAEMLGSNSEYACDWCGEKVNKKTCQITETGKIYCDPGCADGRGPNLDDYA